MRLGSGRLSPAAVLLAGMAMCLLAALVLPRSAPAAITFTRTSTTVGDGPVAVAVGDFSGDGDEELVLANLPPGNKASVLLGQAGGGFGSEQDFATGDQPRSVAVADFNGDGVPDFATANRGDGSVSVLLGRGDGTFTPAREFDVGDTPVYVAVGDFNGDDDPDLAVANQDSNDVSVLLGQPGGGHFGFKRDFVAGRALASVAAGDFNGDGVQDLATANADDDDISVLAGKGDGSFPSRRDFGTGDEPASVAVGDFNQDGDADLAVAENQADAVSVFINASPPVAEVSPASLGFPTTAVEATSARQDVTVKNTGDGGLAISAAAIEGADADQFVITDNAPGTPHTVGLAGRGRASASRSSACEQAHPAPPRNGKESHADQTSIDRHHSGDLRGAGARRKPGARAAGPRPRLRQPGRGGLQRRRRLRGDVRDGHPVRRQDRRRRAVGRHRVKRTRFTVAPRDPASGLPTAKRMHKP